MKGEISNTLGKVAMSYLEIGLEKFHNVKQNAFFEFQPILGLLSTSIELMLKAMIANKDITELYKGISINFEHQPEKIKRIKIILKNEYKTIELHDCVGKFNRYYPLLKDEFNPLFKNLRIIRNSSLHTFVPHFERYELDKIAFLSIKLFKVLKEDLDYLKYYSLTKSDELFFSAYKLDQIKNIEEAVSSARKKAETITYPVSYSKGDETWEAIFTACPICDCDGLLSGETKIENEFIKSLDEIHSTLTFYSDGFICDECGLSLSCIEELSLINLPLIIDRDDMLDIWLYEKGSL